MKTRGLLWGLILICLGLLLLLERLGVLPDDVNVWGVFFAILLIGFGLRWVLIANSTSPTLDNTVSIPFEGAAEVSVKFDYGAGELNVLAGEAGIHQVEGSFTEGVDYSTKLVGNIQHIELKSPNSDWWDMAFWGGKRRRWDVRLPPGIPLNLSFSTGANSSVMDLENLDVKEFRLSTGASSSKITMPSHATHTNAVIKAGAVSVDVKIPEKVAGRISVSGGAAGISVDTLRFPRIGNVYITPNFEISENKVELRVEFGAGSLNVH